MRTGKLLLAACSILAGASADARAQTPLSELPATNPTDRPTTLPPLLKPPSTPTTTLPRPSSGGCDYDSSYLYLPERVPQYDRLPPCPCRPLGTWWLIPTFEMGWSQSPHIPGLVRVGVPTGPTAYGDTRPELPFRSGLSLNAGGWFDRCQNHGIDASFFYFGSGGNDSSVASAGTPLYLPFLNGPAPAFLPLAAPRAPGAFTASLEQRFVSADINYRQTLFCETNTRIDALVGYRFADLRESLTLDGSQVGPIGPVNFRDSITANNQFHGGQIGIAAEHRFGDWYISAVKKIAFGAVVTDTHLDGITQSPLFSAPYGFYSRPGASGTRDHSHFSIMPSLNLNAGRQLGEHCRIFAGYNLQYLDGLTRPGNVLDPTPQAFGLGTRRDVGTTNFWVQTITIGLDVRY